MTFAKEQEETDELLSYYSGLCHFTYDKGVKQAFAFYTKQSWAILTSDMKDVYSKVTLHKDNSVSEEELSREEISCTNKLS